jgi:hypothetical protein
MATHNFEAMAAKLDDTNSGTRHLAGALAIQRALRVLHTRLEADMAQILGQEEVWPSRFGITSRATVRARSMAPS